MIKFKPLKYAILLLGFFAINLQTSAQNPGDLDNTFGTDGIVTYDVQNLGLQDETRKIRVQTDGKIVYVGSVNTPSNTDGDFLIGRLNSDGSLDSAFGLNGTTVTDFGGTLEAIHTFLMRIKG